MQTLGKQTRAKTIIVTAALLTLALVLSMRASSARAQAQTQKLFATPEEAMQALVATTKAKDKTALLSLFGSLATNLLTGDEVQDARNFETFAHNVEAKAKLDKADDAKVILLVGNEDWPFPIPIVKKDGRWFFDTRAGLEEMFHRRIGENEMAAIKVCRAYVLAQWDYFTKGDWDDDGVAEYAQKILSSPGAKDGLYWETVEGEEQSPLGRLVADATAGGYSTKGRGGNVKTAPFHGYYFKLLTRQGVFAPGGTHDYIINNNMVGGHALIAYPATWGNSGVMTFIVNQQGRVYQKDFGMYTEVHVMDITRYSPNSTWMLVAK